MHLFFNDFARFLNSTRLIAAFLAVLALQACGGGGGGGSAPPSATPPGAPSGIAAIAGNASALVSWTPASSDGSPITGYLVTAYVVGPNGAAATLGPTATAGAAVTSVSVPGLVNGTSYAFTVTATNALGKGSPSPLSRVVTPAAVPDAPTAVTASPGNATAYVTWTAPASNGGSPITRYTVTASPGGATATSVATAVTVSGLTNGTSYSFTVIATNAVGTGPVSSASTPVTPSTTALGITIAPRQTGIPISQSQQYTATVTGTANTGVTWSVDGMVGGSRAVGTINSSGLYTAPGTAGAHTVMATSNADATKAAMATIGVTDLAGVFTYHNDIARTGQNLHEYALNAGNVADPTAFGKLFSCALDGTVYAQPLYVPNLALAGGVHNVVFVVTQNDSVYAIDADGAVDPVRGGCLTYWYRNFLTVGVTPVPASDVTGAGDVPGTMGVMGTPVISGGTSSDTIYMVARMKTTTTAVAYTEQLRALNIATGSDIANSPVTIAATVPGTAQSGTMVSFDPMLQAQRPALLLLNGTVYIGFGSSGDTGAYFGWLLAYNAATLAQTAAYNVAPNGPPGAAQGAIWLCGSGPASDGTSIFVSTANGTFDNTNSVVPLGSTNNDMGDSLLRFDPSLVLQDFFTPSDQATDQSLDQDFGSGGVVVLPTSMGSAAHPQLVIATGKPGKFYAEDTANMGRYLGGAAAGTDGNVSEVSAGAPIWGTPAVWGGNIYIAPLATAVRAFSVASGVVSASWTMQGADLISGLGGTPSISAAGPGQSAASNPIVWILDNGANGTHGAPYGPAILRAYDATNLANGLYSSSNVAADVGGYGVKFTVPTIANGKVYVAGGGAAIGTSGQLTVYGLKP